MISSFRINLLGWLILTVVGSLPVKSAEFDLVGREMVRMLQDEHYARLPFNEELSARFLERYLTSLDPDRLYFLQAEVTEIRRLYERRLHDYLSIGQVMRVAEDLFGRYRRRVLARANFSESILKKGGFSFDQERETLKDRRTAPWAQEEQELQKIWREKVETMVLAEEVKRQRLRDRAQELQRPDPFLDAKSIPESLIAKFDRLRQTTAGMTREDLANDILSAVANAYDPHSDYYSANEMAQFRIDMSNELVGIGARLVMNEDGEIEVSGLLNGGPADRQGGLRPGDRIIAISAQNDGDWVKVTFKPIDRVIEYILGEDQAPVGLRFRRRVGELDQVFEIAIPRGVVTLKEELARARIFHLVSHPERPKVAVMTVPSFYFDFEERGSRVSDDVERLISRLNQEGVEGLILDLRDNPGGSLPEAQRLTGFFVGKGPVVQVRSSNGQVRSLPSLHPKPLFDGPMVVMTDRDSASAAEIFAAALQDYRRAILLGSQSTYGKGTVQKALDIADSMPIFSDRDRAGWLKLTFQKYYRVSGSSVQLRGVVPDLILPALTDARPGGERSLKYALPHDVIRASPDFHPRDPARLNLAALRKKSAARVAVDPHFDFVREETERLRNRRKDPSLSLNLEKRLEDLAASEERRRQRQAAQRERFEEIAKRDRERFQIYRLTLDDLETPELPLGWARDDPSDYYQNGDDALAELERELAWPHGLDAEKREALQVLLDVMAQAKEDDLAGAESGATQSNLSE